MSFRERWSGPVGTRDVTPLLTVAAAMSAAKMPLGFLALLGLPVVVVLVQGIRTRATWPRPLAWILGLGLTSSLVAALLWIPAQLAGTNNSFIVMVCLTGVSAAVFAAGRPDRAVHRILDGLFAGLVFTWAMAIFEVVTGLKFMPLLYPQANTAAAVAGNRFVVSGLYPNYNDFSVAMTLLCTCLLAKIFFQPRVGPARTTGRLMILLSATFLITYMGSRGCLLALLLALGCIVLVSVRTLHPQVFTIRGLVLFAGLALAALAALASSPYVRDNSTAQRGVIINNAVQMMTDDPAHLLLGYGALSEYSARATERFGNRLMDPHNVLLEIVLCYGLPVLVAYLLAWWTVVRRGILTARPNPGWRFVAPMVISGLYPLLGVVTSSTLRYHQLWLWLIVALAHLHQSRRAPLTAAQAHTSPALPTHEALRPSAPAGPSAG